MNYSLENITRFPGARIIGSKPGSVTHVSIDSRSLHNGPATLYFALSGPNHDGHDFIPELKSKGVRHFVVSKAVEQPGDAFFIQVHDVLDAFQFFAANHRARFEAPVIAITGSNGKTVVKEWLNFLLGPEYNIARSPKSFNSQTGVPLSVLGIGPSHNLAIIEAGISKPGEMQKLAAVIRPTLGILTNIGSAHDEGFSGPSQKRGEKMKLFDEAQMIIGQQKDLENCEKPHFTWSFETGADINFSYRADQRATTITAVKPALEFTVPFRDYASIENACTCAATMIYLGYRPDVIARRMPNLFPVSMRLSIKNGINSCALIDDSYSLDLESLKIALDFQESQKQRGAKTVILSDFVQSGLSPETLYKQAADLLKKNKVARVIGIGTGISQHAKMFGNIAIFASTADFLEDLPEFFQETILVKGARQFGFEKIVAALEEKTHETVLEINLNAVSHNLGFFRSKLRPGCKLMVMVKAFGYGNGGFEIGKLLEHHNCDYLGVAFADEGISLRQAGISIPIMVMNPELTSFESIIQNNLEPEIYNMRGLRAFIKAAEEKNASQYPVHIKLDTGMHRLGFEKDGLPDLIQVLRATKNIEIKSIFSHLATSDDPGQRDFALEQIRKFDDLSQNLIQKLGISPIRHILNTSGISQFPEAQYDMVRLGIGLYGISNDPQEQPMLQNVGTLKSIISQLRSIPEGDSVGYGRRFVAPKTSLIATVPIGYADGISRHWGNQRGYVMVSGQKAPIVGSICMDMLMADVTDIPCREGDSVILLGEQPSAVEMASALHTIPYEILTSISQRVRRVFYRE